MQKISDLLRSDVENYVESGAPNSERAEMIQQLMEFMGEAVPSASRLAGKETYNRRFKYWLGRTKKLQPAEIYRLMRQAREGKKPQALFNYLLKNYGRKK